MKRKAIFAGIMGALGASGLAAQEQAAAAAVAAVSSGSSIKYIASAIAVSAACIGGGLAVGQVGAAAMGAMSENAELAGKGIVYAGLAEGICLWGFIVALLMIVM